MPRILRFNPQKSQRGYQNITNFLNQRDPDHCNHEGDCIESRCACADNKTTCRPSCKCGHECPRHFPSCECTGSCGSDCVCIQYSRECDPLRCSCSGCINVFHQRQLPSLEVKSSKIPGAGKGLFAKEDIPLGTFLGEYVGRKRLDCEVEATICTNDGMDLFQVSKGRSKRTMHFKVSLTLKDASIQAYKTCKVFYINCENRSRYQNAAFRYIEGKRRRRVIVTAVKMIKKGTEILAAYRYVRYKT
jgi:SET domain-containing protein